MNGLADAVKNGPRARNAKVTDLEARIQLAETKATKASHQAARYRAKAKGDGPLAKYRKIQADGMTDVANQRRGEANRLKVELAKLKASQAAEDAKHARRAVASTRDEFGTGPTGPDQRPGQVTDPGHQDPPRHQYRIPANSQPWPGMTNWAGRTTNNPTKGPTMTAVSGDAVNIEQTRANLDQLKGQVAGLRNSFESMSGSLASGGLNNLAGSLATADDALDSVNAQIEAAERQLADQQGIAEAAQAAGEMHSSSSFYDVAPSPSGGAWSRALDPRAGMTSQDRRAFNERVRRGDPSNGNR